MEASKVSLSRLLFRRIDRAVALTLLVGAVLGVASVAVLADQHSSLRVREAQAPGDGVAEALAQEPGGVGGDSRITWQELPTGLSSELVADGASAWFANIERIGDDGTPVSVVYRYTPGTGHLERVTETPGRLGPATKHGSDQFAFAGPNVVVLVSRGGAVDRIDVPSGDAVAGSGPAGITDLASAGGRLYAVRENVQAVFEIDPTQRASRVIRLPANVTPPANVELLPGGTKLLLSTPFRVGERFDPQTVSVDVQSLRNLDSLLESDAPIVQSLATQRPFKLHTAANGAVYATLASGRGLVEFSGSESVRPVINEIPWDGRFDMAAVTAAGDIWGAPYQAGAVYYQRAGEPVEVYELPQIESVQSVPPGADPTTSTAITTIATLVALDDGTVVFATSSPRGQLGWIPQP